MARLRNVGTGAVVNVPDEKAPRLGPGWVPYEVDQPEEETPKRRPRAKKQD